MKWQGVTRYQGQFTHAVLPHDYNLLTSGRRHINWIGIGHEDDLDVTIEIHTTTPEPWEAEDPTPARYWVGGGDEPGVECLTMADAVAAACDYYTPNFSEDREALNRVLAALATHGISG